MDSVRNMWNRWKKRAQSRTQQATQLDRASNSSMNLRPSNLNLEFKSSRRIISINPTLNDDDITVGKVSQPSYGMKKYHSFQLPTNSEPRMVQAHQTSTLDSKDLDTSEKVEDPQSNRPKILCAPSSVNSRQPSPVTHPIPYDGVSTRHLLMNLLKTGSEKLSFTLQAMELLREYTWMLEMFPNHVHLGEELQVNRWVNRRMTPPPVPRINVFAQPALLALIKTDAQGNWLINCDTLGCLLYFLYRQECKPMLNELDQEREKLERMRQARQEHVEQLKISDKFGSMSLK